MTRSTARAIIQGHWKRVFLVATILCSVVASALGAGFDLTAVADHPRIVANADAFTALRARLSDNPTLRMWYSEVQLAGRALLDAPPVIYELPDGKRLLSVSREVLSRVYTLAFLYIMEGDAAYLERAWVELATAADFPDWNPSHFLDTAEMTHAFAIGYDWLYRAWTPEQRAVIAGAIMDKGIEPALAAYARREWWVTDISNWNIITHSGITLGAIALADEYPDVAETVISTALASIPNFLDRLDGFAGGWDEGLHYWNYSMEYLVPLIATLQTAFGSDFGLLDRTGVQEAATYPIYISGPFGDAFHYGDGTVQETNVPVMFWFANVYNRPEFAAWQLKNLTSRKSTEGRLYRGVWNLLWYTEHDGDTDLALDKFYPGLELITSRSAWDDPEAVFVGFKAGDNAAPHGDLDLGTFVLDALGVRWAIELGSDDYNLPGYFDQDKTGQRLTGARWNYYRKRAEGQNTLVINSSRYPDQDPRAKAYITYKAFTADEMVAITDLSSAYSVYSPGISVQRGIALFDKRRQVIIQDEITAPRASNVWWFMHTEQPVELSDDGRLATLVSGSKRLEARILSPADARFTVMDAVPLPTSPQPDGQNANIGKRKLAIHLGTVNEARIVVLLTPLRSGESLVTLPAIIPLAEWQQDHAAPKPLWNEQPRLRVSIVDPKPQATVAGVVPVTLRIDGVDPDDVASLQLTLNGETVYTGPFTERVEIDTLPYPDRGYQLVATVTLRSGLVGSYSVPVAIDNYTELIDEMEAPVNLGILGIVKRSRTSAESSGWAYTNEPPGLFGDASRRVRTSTSDEYLVWEMPGLIEYEVLVFATTDDVRHGVRLQASTDGATWQALDYDVTEHDVEGDWTAYSLHGVSDGQWHLFQVVLTGDAVPSDSLQVAAVKLIGR